MSTAVIYARFSSDKQREESIDGQIRECKAFAASSDITIVGTYVDRAMSARTDHRPGFLKMIKDSAKGTFDYVIVYQLDRFSRSRYDSAVYKNRLKKNGVKVLSAKENIKDDPSGIILESVLEGYAEYYSAELAQKVRRGMTDNILEKKWNGTRVPFGYRKNKEGHLEIDDKKGAAVKTIFDMFIHGETIPNIIHWLNAHHFRTAAKRPFTRNSLTTILRNQIYTGTYVWNGIESKDFAPPILDEDTYNTAMHIINTRKRTPSGRACSGAYALTGRIYCGVCGFPMSGHSGTSKNGKTHYYYRCSTKNNNREKAKRDGVQCDQPNVRRDDLEALVLKTTVEILSDPKALHCIAEQAAKAQQRTDRQDDIDRLQLMINDLEKRLKNSIRAVEQGVESETLNKNIKDYEKELRRLKQQLSAEKMKTRGFAITPEAVEYFLQQMLTNAKKDKNGEYKLDMFQAFIRRVVVTGNQVEIHYNYHAIPEVLKNPVTRIMTGCSLQKGMVRLEGFEPSHPVPETGALSPEL